MNFKNVILWLLLTLGVYGQSQTPLTVYQSSGSATGAIRLEERRTNGQHYVGIAAPDSITASLTFIMPGVDGTSGQCIITDGAGTLAWATCSASWFVQSGNTFGAMAVLGTNDGYGLSFETDATVRWIIDSAGMLYPNITDTYDFGNDTYRVRGVYGKFGEFFKAGSTASGDYVETRKFKIKDQTGSTGSWDWQANITASNSVQFWRDNAGDPALYMYRQEATVAVNYSLLYTDLRPAKRSTGDGHTVTDATFPALGSTSRRWAELWVDDITTTADVAVGDLLTVTGTTTLNGATNFMSGTLSPAISGLGSVGTSGNPYGNVYTNAITISTGAAVVGNVWTATGTGGEGSWQDGVWNGVRTTATTSLHESITMKSTAGTQYAAPALYWRHSTGNGSDVHMGDISLSAIDITAGTAEESIMAFRVKVSGDASETLTNLLVLDGDDATVKMPAGYLTINGGAEPYTRVHFSDYDQSALAKVFVVDAWIATPTADSGAGKFQMRRQSGSGTIAGGDRTDVRALEAHTTCEYGTGYCWGMELRIGSAITPVTETIQNVGIMVESKSADWIVSPNCDGAGSVGCRNNMGVVVLGVDGWEWPFAYLDNSNIVDWFVDSTGRTNTRGIRFIDNSGASGYSLYWAAEATATASDSSWTLTDAGGTVIIKIDRELSNVAKNYSYWTPDILPATNLGASLGSASNYWFELYALDINIADDVLAGGDVEALGQVRVGSSTSNIGAMVEVQSGSTVNLIQSKYTGAPATGGGGGFTIHQGSAPTAAGQRLGFVIMGVETGGTQYNRVAIEALSGETWALGSAEGTALSFATTSNLSTSRTRRWQIDSEGNWLVGAHNAYTIGTTAARPSKLWVVDLDISGTCTGCGSASLPVADTVEIVEGSSDNTKLLRFEVDGFSAGTTRVLTPQNGSYIIAGTDFSNTFTEPQTFNSSATFSGSTITASSTFSSDLIPTTGSVYALGGSTTRWIGYFNTMNSNGQFTFGGNLIPASSSTYSVGSSSVYPLNVYANYIEPKTELVLGSGIYTRGDVIPATNVTYSLGNSSYKWAAAYLNNTYFYGNIQAPSGSNGLTSTISCGAGQAITSMTVSAGLITAASCGTP